MPTEVAIIVKVQYDVYAIEHVRQAGRYVSAPEHVRWISGDLPGIFPLSLAAEIAARHGLVLSHAWNKGDPFERICAARLPTGL